MEKYLPKVYSILSDKMHLPVNYFYCDSRDSKIYLYSDRWNKDKEHINLQEFIDEDNKEIIEFAISRYGTKIEI